MQSTIKYINTTKTKNLHLISFNVPYPANYGGVIDVFYKIKALAQLGVKIHLHAFEYGRTPQAELNKWCTTVNYYPRNTHFTQQFSILPYIVQSRQHPLLLKNLLKDNAPILFEGVHTCALLSHPALKNRLKIVRMHNVEWQYYQHLANIESNILKKIYFKIESWRLKNIESIVKNADTLLAIASTDQQYFKQIYPKSKTIFVPAFHANDTITSRIGHGKYALFHGDLSVKDNEKAALFLIEKVFNNLNVPFIIAGLNPSKRLKEICQQYQYVDLKANVPNMTMQKLIQAAHVNVLLSFHIAGMKLKLLNALFNGRFCIVNPPMVAGTGLKALCVVAATPTSLQTAIIACFQKKFTTTERNKRETLLKQVISNKQGAEKIMQIF